MADSVTFGELVGLMVWGRGTPDSFRGVMRRREDGRDQRYRLMRRGSAFRDEQLDGTVRRIVGEHAMWFRDPDEDVMRVMAHDRYRDVLLSRAPIGGLDVGGPRPSCDRWSGTDFTRPTGPVSATEFLGRRAWAVELAPPSHKPHPLQLVVDAATGLLLRKANEGFGSVEEWIELEFDPDLPDELFTWDGPAVPVPTHADREAQRKAEEAERHAWLEQRGLADVPITVALDLRLHDWDDESGALYASLESRCSGTLIRRPHSTTPWPETDDTDYPHSWRWTDYSWDWFLGTDSALTGPILDDLKARLAATS